MTYRGGLDEIAFVLTLSMRNGTQINGGARWRVGCSQADMALSEPYFAAPSQWPRVNRRYVRTFRVVVRPGECPKAERAGQEE